MKRKTRLKSSKERKVSWFDVYPVPHVRDISELKTFAKELKGKRK
jgi:hypothetical protein